MLYGIDLHIIFRRTIKPKVVINRIFLFLITSILNQITIARLRDDSVLNTELSVLF